MLTRYTEGATGKFWGKEGGLDKNLKVHNLGILSM